MFTTSAENLNYTPQIPAQTLKNLINELSTIRMPSSLWGVHVDSNQQFLAFSVLNISEKNLKTSKSVVFSETKDNILKIQMFMNNTHVEIPYISRNVTNISELNNLLMAIDAVEFCKYYSPTTPPSNRWNPCAIYNLPFMDVCSWCLNNNIASDHKTGCNEENDTNMNKLRDVTFNNFQKNGMMKGGNNPCILCKKVFNGVENLSKHYKDHLLKNNDDCFQCTICFSLFDDINAILEHYREYHSNVKFIKCSACNKKFTNTQQLRRHIRNHTGYEAFTCDCCYEDFISKKKLKNHICKKSKIPRMFSSHTCSVCNTQYATNRLLQQHEREHQIRVSLKCKECQKSFENADQAVDHKMHCKKRKLRYACKTCEKRFSCVSQKWCHIKKVHPSLM